MLPAIPASPRPVNFRACHGITINTAKAHKWRANGEVTQLLTWVNGERAMVLLATHRKGSPWYVLMDSAAWECLQPQGWRPKP